MLQYLEQQTKLTGNQRRIITAAVLGDMLEFFDYFLIGYVVAFIAGPWKLTFGESAVILLSSGFGAMFGAVFYGWLADKIGRRKVFLMTVINFSVATGILTFTPDNAWIFLSVFRFLIGFGVGGLYCVDLPLVQEFVPASKRGMVGGLVTAAVPIGVLLGAALGAFATPYVGWRGLFAIGMVPGLLTLLDPRLGAGITSLADPDGPNRGSAEIAGLGPGNGPGGPPNGRGSAGGAEAAYVPALGHLPVSEEPGGLVDHESRARRRAITGSLSGFRPCWSNCLGVTPARASFLLIFVNFAGLFGRVGLSYLSDAIGRKASGAIASFGAAILMVAAALYHNAFFGTVSVFWLLLIVNNAFADGGFAIVGPYSAEVWPVALRTTGMGSAYGFGGLGKVIGPLGLALIVGSSNIITPKASVAALLPSFSYLAAWFALAGLAYIFIGMETKGRSLETIEQALDSSRAPELAQTKAEQNR